MIRTRVCDLLGIEHPVFLGGLGGGHTTPDMVAAVSAAGGFGAQGCHMLGPRQIAEASAAIRAKTDQPFALNFLLFLVDEECFAAALVEKPAAIVIAWPRPEQDLAYYIGRAHRAGCKTMVMVGGVPEAVRANEAGADIIIAQGTEGGGHVGWMATMALVPMVIDAVGATPVIAAGGIADGRGLAAALALGADGVLLGTRFLASDESPLHANFKKAIVDASGHDTVLSEIPDLASGTVWPGAMSRTARNAIVERWSGREWALRQHRTSVMAGIVAARKTGDIHESTLSYGQDAGLIHDIAPSGEIVRRIVREAEEILSARLPKLIQQT